MTSDTKKGLGLADFVRFSMPTDEEMDAIRARRIEEAKANPTCFTHWFGAVQALGIPHPRSKVIDFPYELTGALLDEKWDDSAEPMASVIASIREFGERVGYPLFIKNSLFSGKHEWAHTCFIPADATDDQVAKQITWLTHLWAMVGGEVALHLIVREFIETDPIFHAFGGMPVTAEFRLFATDGQLNGWQPYWPEAAIQEPSVEDWADRLKTIEVPGQDELLTMQSWAEAVSAELGGFWSVDFLRGRHGKLYLIDMAEGKKSYRCPVGYREA